MEQPNRSIETSASQASSGKPNKKLLRAENNGIQRWRPVKIPDQWPRIEEREIMRKGILDDRIPKVLSRLQDAATVALQTPEVQAFLWKHTASIEQFDKIGDELRFFARLSERLVTWGSAE